jgi:murein DD-endopeptidase MepM/ murein hydrolase activator NlpD
MLSKHRRRQGPLAVAAIAAAIACGVTPAPAAAQTPAAKAPAASAKAANATKGASRPSSPQKPKAPIANKNIALGEAAVPAQPKALLSHGCLDATHGRWLSSRFEASDVPADLRERVDRLVLPPAAAEASSDGPTRNDSCLPFAAVRTPAGNRIESLALMPAASTPPGSSGDLQRAMLVLRSPEAGQTSTTRWQDLGGPGATGERELWLPAATLLAGDAAEQVPARWQRELALLVRQMKKHTSAPESATVRIVLRREAVVVDGGEPRAGGGGSGGSAESAEPEENIVAVELIDTPTGRALDSAIWMARADAPSGFVSAGGGDYERVLWQAPVDFRRISRGVGSATVIVRKRVFAAPKTPGGKPRVVVRSFRSRGQHQGIDFAAPTGTQVVTVAEGTVVHAAPNGGYGNLVIVDHGGGVTTYYAHLSAFGPGIAEGARVERGQEIGLVGSTGMSTGPHLHYEIRREGKYLDPADPAQALANWALSADEHEPVLTRLLQLSMTRAQGLAAARAPAIAAHRSTGAEAE